MSRLDHQTQPLTCLNASPNEFHILDCLSMKYIHQTRKTEQFFERSRNEVWIVVQALQFARVLQKSMPDIRQEARQRLR